MLQTMMGRSRFLVLLLVSSLLFLSFGHGFGRVALMEKKTLEHRHSSTETEELEHGSEMRIMLEIMDYPDPEPNPKNGHNFTPPSPPPALPPHADMVEVED